MMSIGDKILVRKRGLIERVNEEVKNIGEIEEWRDGCFKKFM